ncbi:MAG: hypothetical protein WAN66_01535 [Limnoraphis robusta]|jgi:hypothetical protein|uniref:Isochorismate synthase n=1 Tax=Limnoraphis robusta CCNP1315 TaxID=3110306 RepID=A0ABU5TSR0_9CYAN|nr:hypothetical protein [Limnoraphis robusta]MEA5496806.1 hypothetical protein [Limnoraphis robusta BA-68 BA1]MEA5517608.1 hypothetical protein [Limnoraphis robusta CCNP1315]MEA5541346.1 hypothetical protein [Limnoraphis robusta Tam1]MEA5544590.1 hypothetical protein [Limnoraphis robusta CCNP1324]
MSKITQRFQEVFEFIGLGVKRIFSGNTDQYPKTGVQPYEGDRSRQKNPE